MRLLVTGARGLLGRALVARARVAGHEVAGLGRAELDVTEAKAVAAALEAYAPEVVVNCAAYTQVDRAEREPEAAFRVNRDGARVVAEAAARRGVRLVQLSTDYVYPGDRGRPLHEDDAEGPLSVYGRSKLAGDEAVRAAHPGHLIVRSSWLYGADGAHFVAAILARARRGEKLRVVDDQIGSPTWSEDLVQAIVGLLATSARGTLHVANTGAVSWLGLARAALRLAGLGELPIEAITSAELGRPAARPAYSALDTTRYARLSGRALPSWERALERYMTAGEERRRDTHAARAPDAAAGRDVV